MKIQAISISSRKGIRKKNVERVRLIENFGLENDAHGGDWHRQVSFLAQESIDTMRAKGLDVVAGNFAENITTSGIDLLQLSVGSHLTIGDTHIILSQLGKVCHHKCAIYHQAGDCVMPREGIFGVVNKGGFIEVGDSIIILPDHSPSASLITPPETSAETTTAITNHLQVKNHPAFVRIDHPTPHNDGIFAVLDDLLNTQKISKIYIYDPENQFQLHQLQLRYNLTLPSSSETLSHKLVYCRTVDEIMNCDKH